MADNYDTTIKVGLEADLSGGVQTEKQLEQLKRKARELGKEGSAAGSQMENSIGKVTKAVGNLRRLMGGFGIVALVMQAVNAFKEWRKSIQEAEDKAKALRDSLKDAADAKAVKEMANAYKEVADRIAEAADERKRSNDLLSEEVRLRREAEDAQTDLEEAQALAGVDASDPAAEEQRAAIKARFAARRAGGAASRKREDVIMRMAALDQEARTSTAAADELEATLGADKSALVRARTSSRVHHALSKEMTDRDITWYGARKKTEEGDAVRKDHEQRAEKADAEVEKLEANLKAKEKEIARLRAQAADAMKRHQLMGTALSTADVASSAADITSGMATDSADRSLAKRNAQIAKDRKTLADAPLLDSYNARMDEEKARAQAAADRYAKEQGDVIAAQGRLDMLTANGGSRKEKSAALAALQKEKDEAAEAKHEMEKVAADVANTLKAITTQIKTLSRAVDQAKRRMGQDQADAPEG